MTCDSHNNLTLELQIIMGPIPAPFRLGLIPILITIPGLPNLMVWIPILVASDSDSDSNSGVSQKPWFDSDADSSTMWLHFESQFRETRLWF